MPREVPVVEVIVIVVALVEPVEIVTKFLLNVQVNPVGQVAALKTNIELPQFELSLFFTLTV